MAAALQEISNFLGVPEFQVQQKLENPIVKQQVINHLKENFNLFVDYADRVRWINFHGMTFKSASRLHAYNGKNEISAL